MKHIFKNVNLQPFLYLIAYYYSYSFLYEREYGKKIFKKTVSIFHKHN